MNSRLQAIHDAARVVSDLVAAHTRALLDRRIELSQRRKRARLEEWNGAANTERREAAEALQRELVDGHHRYEWSAATPPFYDEPNLFVDVAICEVVPCVLCCPVAVGFCQRCHSRDLSHITAGLPVSPPLDLRGYLPVFLLQCGRELCAACL